MEQWALKTNAFYHQDHYNVLWVCLFISMSLWFKMQSGQCMFV